MTGFPEWAFLDKNAETWLFGSLKLGHFLISASGHSGLGVDTTLYPFMMAFMAKGGGT